MTKTIEIAAMALGGVSLFAVCFLGFALLSGTPLADVPLVGSLLRSPELTPPAGAPAQEPPQARERTRSRPELVASALGTLGAWSLPSPFRADELAALEDELQAELHEVEVRARALDERERELDERAHTLAERFETLEDLRRQLDTFAQELELRESEVLVAEEARDERQAARWNQLATVLAALDPRAAGERLVAYEPQEAAQALRALPPETAAEILNELGADEWKAYVDAYTALAGA